METYQRPLTEDELNTIAQVLHREVEQNAHPIIKRLQDLPTAINSLYELSLQERLTIFYHEDKFIGIVICSAYREWWSQAVFLQEHLVLCVSSTYKGFNRVAIKYLEDQAKLCGASAIVAGCAFRAEPQVVTNSYLKAGFKYALPTYCKLLVGEKNHV